jgi:arylsulfatase A-like enzyme
MIRSILAAAVVGLAGVAGAAEVRRPPNIVMFLADDLGQRDLGCYGSTFHETPYLDKLAKEGVRFTRAYAACPVCSPTRASILTGKWPTRTGVTDYIGAAQPDKWPRNTKLLPAPYSTRLELGEVTIAEALKAGGYKTFFAGKWHLGPQGHWPEDQGFEINMGGTNAGGPYGGNKYFSPYGNPRLTDGPAGEHLPDRLATEAGRFIEANRDKPFFVSYWLYDVHTPLMAREDLRKKYLEKKQRMNLKAEWGREGERDVRLVQEHAVYAGMVEAMDAAVGKVVAKIEALGLKDDTIIIFTSDNGGLSTSEGHPTSNAPLRGGKGWLYEGGVREPLIVWWPGGRKGAVDDTVVSSPDFMPTILEAAGVPMPAGHPGDGVSLTSLMRNGQKPPERPIFWHYPHYGNQGGAPGGAMLLGDWKLIEWYEEDVELFNLKEDAEEQRNLAGEQRERVAEMRTLLEKWRKETGAKMPSKNDRYDATKPSGRAGARPREMSNPG